VAAEAVFAPANAAVDYTVLAARNAIGEEVLVIAPPLEDEVIYKLCVQALHPAKTIAYDSTFTSANEQGQGVFTEFRLPGSHSRVTASAHDLGRALTGMGFTVKVDPSIYEQPLAA
jgi:hypothetical protein